MVEQSNSASAAIRLAATSIFLGGPSVPAETPSLKIVRVNPVNFERVLHSLFEEHREELTTNKELMVLKPDILKYQRLFSLGSLHSLIALEGDKIVGYSINIMDNSLHYMDVKFFNNDVLFLSKEHRKGRAGIKLIKATEELAKEVGADMMLWHAKTGTNLDKLLTRWKYKTQDVIYSKEL